MSVSVKGPGGPVRKLELECDAALADEEDCLLSDLSPLVTKGAEIEPNDLAAMLMDGYFTPGEDHGCDSYDTQEVGAGEITSKIAVSLLRSPEEAMKQAICDALQYSDVVNLPSGTDVVIHIGADRKMTVSIKPAG